jgi:hypothetical protein
MKKILAALIAITLTMGVFAQGFYIEYKIGASGKEASVGGNFKTYSQGGDVRSEITMSVPQMGEMQITSLSLKTEPNKIYLLNEKEKTYTEMATGNDEEWKDRAQSDYEVTVLGKETINGYNTTHVSIKINGKQREELWTTRDIAGYGEFAKIKTKYTGKDNLYKALAAKSADGLPVRIKVDERGHNMQMDLVKAEKRSNPANLFSLDGYKKGEGMSGMPGGEQIQEMMKNMQNMTPAEREEMIRQLKEQYGKQPH